jgi:endo-1,4-beta-xylanase
MGVRGDVLGRIGVLAALFALLAAPQVAPAQVTPSRPKLRAVPQGTALRLSAVRNDTRYRDTFLREFDSLTPENEMKMAALQPRRGQFDFAAADALVDFARRNRRAVHGHALVWGLSVPLWLADPAATALPGALGKGLSNTTTLLRNWRRDELLPIMTTHIRTVMSHFAGDVGEWDVVNEPMADDGGPAPSIWQRFIGPDYVELALRAARAADPRAKLFINEYGVEGPGRKLEGLVELVRALQKRDVPLDGIGLQMHSHILGFHDQATLESTMRRFAAMGLEVQVTEMDVGTSLLGGIAALDRLTRQADAYGAAARACNAVAACRRFTTWGFTDRLSWIGVGEAPLLFDASYRPKPAFDAVRSAFAPRGRPAGAAAPQRRWRWRSGTGARCGFGSCAGLRAGRG